MTKKLSEIDIVSFPPSRERAAYAAEALLIAGTTLAGLLAALIMLLGLGR